MSEIVPFNPNTHGPASHEPRGAPRGHSAGYPEPLSEAAGLREYVAIARRQIWLVLAVVTIIVGPAIYRVMKAPPRYRATSTIRLTDPRREMTGSSENSPFDIIGGETDIIQSQIEILASQAVGAEAVDMGGLRLDPAPGRPFVDEITSIRVADSAKADSIVVRFTPASVTATTARTQVMVPYGQPLEIEGVSFTVSAQPPVAVTSFRVIDRKTAIGRALDGLKAVPRPKTDIIDLSYVGYEPHQARRISTTMARAFQAHNISRSQQQSRRRRVFLEGQLTVTDSMLRSATEAYSGYRSRAQVFSSTAKASAEEQGLIQMDAKRADLDAQRRMYESLLVQVSAGDASDAGMRVLMSSPGIAGNPVIQQAYSQLTAHEAARESLLMAGAAPTNPDVLVISSRISATGSKLIAAVRSQIQALNAQIAVMDNQRTTTSSKIAAAPAAETEEGQLSQQVQTIQKMADELQRELHQAKMAEAVEAGEVEIVDLASVPGGPIGSGAPRKVALAFIIALFIAVGLAVVVDTMNTSIKRRADIETLLQVPGLAVIPRLARHKAIEGRVRRALPRRGNGRTPAEISALDLVTVTDFRSASAEAFRTLRTNLIFSQSVQALRTIVVTSASPNEGKTITSANLAVSFAHHGMRVLLLDCDLRRGRLHRVFQIAREPGITELVIGREDPEAVTRETNVKGLYVIPSGNLPPNPSELLGGERMRQALAALSEAFDLIVIDSPPLLAASDAAILATLSDGVVLVLRAGSTEGEAARQAIEQLNAVGARVVGAVLNDPDAKVPSYRGYYHYEYAGADNRELT